MYFSGTHYLLFLLTYLLCAIPFGFLVVRIQKGTDVRKTGSGNIGATNVLRASGKMAGIVTLVLDAMKGALAVWGAGHFSAHNPRVVAVCAVIALLAHMFPLYLKFKGGKGVSTGLGVFLVLAPWPTLGAVGVFILTVVITRYVSLGSILAAAAFPALCFFAGFPGNPGSIWLLSSASLCGGLIIWRHSQNIRRLVQGQESRFGGGKS